MLPGNQANTEYWFRLLYDCLHGSCYGSMAGLSAFFAHLWLWIIVIGYMLAILGLFVIVYCTVRLFELRKREEEYYSTLIAAPEAGNDTHPRWEHIQSLLEGGSPSAWREAIIEADILLDDALTRQGYIGESIGDKLKSADRISFSTLNDAWEAHKVRNQIAHEGYAFNLSEELTRRTIAHYEAVFREFKII